MKLTVNVWLHQLWCSGLNSGRWWCVVQVFVSDLNWLRPLNWQLFHSQTLESCYTGYKWITNHCSVITISVCTTECNWGFKTDYFPAHRSGCYDYTIVINLNTIIATPVNDCALHAYVHDTDQVVVFSIHLDFQSAGIIGPVVGGALGLVFALVLLLMLVVMILLIVRCRRKQSKLGTLINVTVVCVACLYLRYAQ